MFSGESEDIWLNVADIMSGMMLVFMGIAVFFMMDINRQKEELEDQQEFVNNIVTQYDDVRTELFYELQTTFQGKLDDWGAQLDQETLSIRFVEPSCLETVEVDDVSPKVFFQQSSAALTPFGREVVHDFFPTYVAILSKEKFKKHVLEIRIEGHTSKEWSSNTSEDASYLHNLRLSQARASSVVELIATLKEDTLILQHNWSWMTKHLTANGLSSSQLIVNEWGEENSECSRRVEFRVVTDSEAQMDVLLDRQ